MIVSIAVRTSSVTGENERLPSCLLGAVEGGGDLVARGGDRGVVEDAGEVVDQVFQRLDEALGIEAVDGAVELADRVFEELLDRREERRELVRDRGAELVER